MSTSNLETAPLDRDPEFTFSFVEFNPRRQRRGAEAARVAVIVDGVEDDILWMSEKDLRNNLEIFGQHPALLTALAYYTGEIAVIPSDVDADSHLSQSYVDRMEAPDHEAA